MAIKFGLTARNSNTDCSLYFTRLKDGSYDMSITGDFSECKGQIDFDILEPEDVEELIQFFRVKKPVTRSK